MAPLSEQAAPSALASHAAPHQPASSLQLVTDNRVTWSELLSIAASPGKTEAEQSVTKSDVTGDSPSVAHTSAAASIVHPWTSRRLTIILCICFASALNVASDAAPAFNLNACSRDELPDRTMCAMYAMICGNQAHPRARRRSKTLDPEQQAVGAQSTLRIRRTDPAKVTVLVAHEGRLCGAARTCETQISSGLSNRSAISRTGLPGLLVFVPDRCRTRVQMR